MLVGFSQKVFQSLTSAPLLPHFILVFHSPEEADIAMPLAKKDKYSPLKFCCYELVNPIYRALLFLLESGRI